ncbi:hypothetical protein LAh9_26 [Aeromonas phage LAh_9]|uniref:Uncharacterized protein n=2 Tax=Lahexavirus TaxID=2843411 RepID=A0A514A160_9CAUD|nr:hypothetical protein HWC30_gp144 [Aeromonas phage LAh_6]YP_009847507.1 hypothetical protein HWC32_gp026 [Aeromonas phage LAh_9]QDH46636.1 hypothetical protein LAh6_144 [Aeromonas phage LAh_6]QDH47004.1 hypothetical protein LAh9_26 [Aeromonas phage LAh_9]
MSRIQTSSYRAENSDCEQLVFRSKISFKSKVKRFTGIT